jgi:Alkyl sulfatase C-terminal
MAAALTVEQLFDSIAIRVNGPKAWTEHLTIDWHFTDLGERYRMSLSNGVLVHYPNPGPGDADLAFTLTKPQLLGPLAGGGPDGVEHNGDVGALQRLLSVLETPCHLRDRDIVDPRGEASREVERPRRKVRFAPLNQRPVRVPACPRPAPTPVAIHAWPGAAQGGATGFRIFRVSQPKESAIRSGDTRPSGHRLTDWAPAGR